MLKYATLSVLTLLCCSSLQAQGDTTYYYSNNSSAGLYNREKAAYYEISDTTKRNGKINRFYLDHTLYGVASYTDDEMDGPYISYYKAGNVKESGLYNKDEAVGVRKRRYQNGTMRSIEVMNNQEMNLESPKMITAWDSLGTIMVEKGVGDFEAPNFNNPSLLDKGRIENGNKVGQWVTYENGRIEYQEEFDSSGILSSGVSYDSSGNSFSYTEVYKDAEYPGGEKAWKRFLKRNLKYPEEARKKNIEGAVFLEFQVNKTGEVRYAVILRGFHTECDKEAYRVLNLSKNWTPAQQRGKIVEQTFTIRVVFDLI